VRLKIIAVGKLKTGPEKALAVDYLERIEGLGRKTGITRIEIQEFAESTSAQESQAILAALPPGARTIALDERGQALSSISFASLLKAEADKGTQTLAFLIGGTDGHTPAIREAASHTLSFGPATWPHRLVRVMLLEQIYRAVTIMVNHPYHRA
jgi:23S rRNA (pseudouridine1915-N3)-methyltransferase